MLQQHRPGLTCTHNMHHHTHKKYLHMVLLKLQLGYAQRRVPAMHPTSVPAMKYCHQIFPLQILLAATLRHPTYSQQPLQSLHQTPSCGCQR